MNIAVVGGGPSGMFAAITAAKLGAEVTLFEKNEKLGKKLYITGMGRCNLTNNCSEQHFLNNVVTNSKFLYSAIYSFSCMDTIEFFENNGLHVKTERGNRVFPSSDKASDVTKTLTTLLRKYKVKINLNCAVKGINISENCVLLTTISDIVAFDKVIIATGGISYSKTGSTGDGYRFANSIGLATVLPVPALTEVYTKQDFSSLAGLTLKNVTLSVTDDSNKSFYSSEIGDVLFTHRGLSGPLVLSASSFINREFGKRLIAHVDLKPALNYEQLDARVLRDFEKHENKMLENALCDLLPNSLISPLLSESGLDCCKRVNQVTAKERAILCHTLKDFPLELSALAPIDEAIVTSGGIDVLQIDPKTMRCKAYPNIYFVGEVLNVDALTGGFNMQTAFSTGFVAGKDAATITNNSREIKL